MTIRQIQQAFTQLGHYLCSDDTAIKAFITSSHHHNAWFTPDQVDNAVKAAGSMLNEADIERWFDSVHLSEHRKKNSKTVGLVLAGNIPLVGLHDVLTVLASGHSALIKLSSQDKFLTPHILSRLVEFYPHFGSRIVYTERLKDFDAVIATGSNNTSRYFEFYFKNVPHIIRRNRNSVAVLDGSETQEELVTLGHDIFDYYGLGCRNVSKLYVPAGYNFTSFFEAIEQPFKDLINHHKYANNYDYNKSIYLVNGDKHLDNGFLLVKHDEAISSPLAVLFFSEYNDISSVEQELKTIEDQIQCVVVKKNLNINSQQVKPGNSQKPKLWDYADGVNTFDFLLNL